MNKSAILFIACISISSCVNFDRASNTNNYYEINITFEQACILKNHYQKHNKVVPASIQSVIDESNGVCK